MFHTQKEPPPFGCSIYFHHVSLAPTPIPKESTEAEDIPCGLHPATYTTAAGGSAGAGAGIVDPEYGHTSGIVSVVAIPTPKEGGGDAMGMGGMLALRESNSFQVDLPPNPLCQPAARGVGVMLYFQGVKRNPSGMVYIEPPLSLQIAAQ